MFSTKDHVISRLLRSGEYISGQSLSDELNISRAAVNAAVRSLKQDGYDISSVTNKGYRLNNRPDLLTAGSLLSLLPETRMRDVIILDKIDSTNKYLKSLASEGAPSGTVVISNCQTEGRGRLGRSFISPPDKGIYLSYLMKPSVPFDLVSRITCWTAVTAANAVEEACGICPDIKWVNDLQINGKKICGILTEMIVESEISSISNVIIGIGINVNHLPSDFPDELRNTAASLRMELPGNEPLYRASIAAGLINGLDRMCREFPDAHDRYLDSYRRLCSTTGLDVSVVSAHNHTSEIPRTGKAMSIGEDFSLKVLFDDGHEENLSSGEVSVRRR